MAAIALARLTYHSVCVIISELMVGKKNKDDLKKKQKRTAEDLSKYSVNQ